MAGGNFRGSAQVVPIAYGYGQFGGAQNRKAEAGCVSKSELECPSRQHCGLRQNKRSGYDACRVEQLGGGTGVRVVKTPSDQNLAVREQGREMVATPTNQWQRWQPSSSGGIVQFRRGRINAAKITHAANSQDLAARQHSRRVN